MNSSTKSTVNNCDKPYEIWTHLFHKYETDHPLIIDQLNQTNERWHHQLTNWGRVTHICVGKLTTIGSDNGLSPGRRQAITWTNAGILLIETLGTNFSDILIGIKIFSFKKMRLKNVCEMGSILSRPQCVKVNPNMLAKCDKESEEDYSTIQFIPSLQKCEIKQNT